MISPDSAHESVSEVMVTVQFVSRSILWQFFSFIWYLLEFPSEYERAVGSALLLLSAGMFV